MLAQVVKNGNIWYNKREREVSDCMKEFPEKAKFRISHPWIKAIGFICFAAAVVLGYYLGMHCVFGSVLGINCPGCGMTRAYRELLHLNLVGAFRFNYMFWSVPLVAAYILTDGHLFRNRAVNIAVLAVIGAGFAVLFVLRLFGILTV